MPKTPKNSEKKDKKIVKSDVHRFDSEIAEFDPTDTPYTGLTDIDFNPYQMFPDGELTPAAAYRSAHDTLILDGHSRQNLATFGTTWMEPQAVILMSESFDKNAIDHDEYPATSELESRCVQMIADLFHAKKDKDDTATGVSTIGSSEAVMLAALAMKWRWREKREKEGKDTSQPNLVLGTNVQIVWEKFCRYFDVEPKYIPLEPGRYVTTPELFAQTVDENTIGVVAIMGTTFTGEFEDVAGISRALDTVAKNGGPDVPIHVDAASGGFIAPFAFPELEWDFRVKRVVSINTSGHKYGLVYPGVGWVIWRSQKYLPEGLIFNVNYLGGTLPTFTLNFSKSATQIIGQYYNLIRYGRSGYTRIVSALKLIANHISIELNKFPEYFTVISQPEALPLIALEMKPDLPFTGFDISHELRTRGWQVPAYTMPKNAENVVVLRIVVRAGFSAELAKNLVDDFKSVLKHLSSVGTVHSQDNKPFIH